MPTLTFGNAAVVVAVDGAQAVVHANGDVPDAPTVNARPDLGQQITVFNLPDEASALDVASAWPSHSASPPAWVEGDDDGLVAAVAEHFGCPVGCPVSHDEWKEG